jgi:pSer/pThr/pTyr-binding forkhead associated (FHA) protein
VDKDGETFELLPIERPVGDHLMLEGVSDKANNMMVIQNMPVDGIRIGRGHECEIRVTDISVSRNHAKIGKNGDDYLIFDNKSKFGTLVREQRLTLELSKIKQGIQIGRTVITFEKTRRSN